MPATVHVNPGWFVGGVVATIFVILYPIVLAIVAHRRLRVGWRYFGFGALIFLLFQLVTRVPAVTVLQNVFGAQLKASSVLLYSWLAILALTAGIFEEVGRYVGYRWLMRKEEKTWSKAIMYGIGHGGLESMLLIGGQLLLTMINLSVVSTLNLNTLPASAHAQVVQQVAAINAQPAWTSLLGAWERLWTLPFHIAMSVVVLQVFRRKQIGWLLLAILLHALVDGTAVFVPRLLGTGLNTSLILEGLVMVFGLLSIWIIWRLRDQPDQESGIGETPGVMSDVAVSE